MEAAKLVKVTDSKDKGVNALPSAGSYTGWIAKGTVGSGPAPTPAINSGKKLDSSILAASHNNNDASTSRYPDNDGND